MIGVEILKECVSRPLDAIFVCCGGGGMLAGIAAYVKRVRPSIKVIGVEAEDAAGSFKAEGIHLKYVFNLIFCSDLNHRRHDSIHSRWKGRNSRFSRSFC